MKRRYKDHMTRTSSFPGDNDSEDNRRDFLTWRVCKKLQILRYTLPVPENQAQMLSPVAASVTAAPHSRATIRIATFVITSLNRHFFPFTGSNLDFSVLSRSFWSRQGERHSNEEHCGSVPSRALLCLGSCAPSTAKRKTSFLYSMKSESFAFIALVKSSSWDGAMRWELATLISQHHRRELSILSTWDNVDCKFSMQWWRARHYDERSVLVNTDHSMAGINA